jgi:predicted PurR-regulated permease PerM
MELRGWKRGNAAMCIFCSFLLITFGLLILAIPHVLDQIGLIEKGFVRYFPDTSPSGLRVAFAKLNVPAAFGGVLIQAFEGLRGGFLQSSTWLSQYGMNFLSNLVWVVIVPIVAFYALRDYHLILAKALLLLPPEHRGSTQTYIAEVSGIFARYVRGLAIVSVLNGIATWLLLALLHVPGALVVGLVAGVLYSVPYVGAVLTVVFTAGAAFVGGGVQMMAWAVGLSVIMHQVLFDQVLGPKIIGGQVGLHPIISIVALLAGNLLFGIVGMILAVPVAACVQIGVLAFLPKLQAHIEISADHLTHQRTDEVEEQTKASQLEMETPADIHDSVIQAVEDLEAQLEAEERV